ncbi:MAG: GDP-mannose 4,6-dehydratase [Planctomycetota bacterium]
MIIGSEGQDGTWLRKFLAEKGYAILGIDVSGVTSSGVSWNRPVNISDRDTVIELIQAVRPDEVYYLAARHHASEDRPAGDYGLYLESYSVNLLYLLHFLEAIRLHSRDTRLFYAASSHIFGDCEAEMQDESTPCRPDTIYGITKLDGLLACRYYRKVHGVRASVGIMYNHESHLRAPRFISRKIVLGATGVQRNTQDKIRLGDLGAEVDWGFAPDYVDAMHRILNAPEPDEFIVATGRKHSVKEFVETAFELLGMDWRPHVVEESRMVSGRQAVRVGDARKLASVTGWRPTIGFRDMIRIMLEEDGARVDTRDPHANRIGELPEP